MDIYIIRAYSHIFQDFTKYFVMSGYFGIENVYKF